MYLLHFFTALAALGSDSSCCSRKTITVLIALLFWLASPTSAQRLDSFKTQLSTRPTVEQRVRLLLSRADFLAKSDQDSALHYATRAERLSRQTNDANLVAQVRLSQASIYLDQGRYEEAQKLLMLNLDYPSLDSTQLGLTHMRLGSALNYQLNYDDGITEYLRALSIFDATQDTVNAGRVLTSIGSVHAKLGNLKQAIGYLQRALAYAQGDQMLTVQVLSNLAGAYYEGNNVDQAIATAHQAEVLLKKLDAPVYMVILYSNLCYFYMKQGNFERAIHYGQRGLDANHGVDQNTDLLLNNIGSAWLQRKKPRRAISYFTRISSSIEDDLRAVVLHNFMEAYQQLDDADKALSYATQYADLKDSIHTKAHQATVADLTEKYESEKKQQQIDLLRTQNELNQTKLQQQRLFTGGLSVFLLFSVAFGFLWLKNQRTRQSLLTARIRHQLLQTQLNPHFLFHALNSIQRFICHSRKEESVQYLSSFSKLMRSILESSDQDFVTVAEDAQALSDYLHLQQLNALDQAYRYQITVDEQIDEQLTVLPPMFTQPFVENALVHGIGETARGRVSVHYRQDTDTLRITIQDNGSGYDARRKGTNSLYRSMSTDILNERIANLKKVHRYYCDVKVDAAQPGTRVSLVFPLRYRTL